MDDKFLIHVDIADRSYGLWIDRSDEQLARDQQSRSAIKCFSIGIDLTSPMWT